MALHPVALPLVLTVVLTAHVRTATAEPNATTAAAQVRAQLEQQWRPVVDGTKLQSRWRVVLRGERLEGDWVVHHRGFSYLLGGGQRRCTVQWARAAHSSAYLMCGERDIAELRWSETTTTATLHADHHAGRVPIGRIEVSASPARVDLAMLAKLSRAISGWPLAIRIDADGRGHTVIETIVSTPATEAGRQSWRYAVGVTLTTDGFTVGLPMLLESYRETCTGVNGCHDTHWTCRRVK